MSTTLRAEFFVDDEVNTWHYRVPALHINGGGTATREDAQRECMDAIAFVLEGDPSEYDSDTHAIAFEISVAPAAGPPPPSTDGVCWRCSYLRSGSTAMSRSCSPSRASN